MLGSIELSFDIKDFQYYFYPAYCITCHVSQGCTFDEPFTIYDWSHACMDKAAKYVAVSRATSIKYVQINKFSYTKRD
jgi:ATP-dependent exoDNAse (exonuclease V) alpha subunit